MLLPFFIFSPLILSQGDQCTLLSDGIVISKYHLEGCGACVKFNPVYEEIKSRAAKEQLNIKFREVECGSCDCGDISKFPTLEITQDKQPKGTSIGYKDYKSFSKWITDILLLDKNVFTDHIEHVEGKIKILHAADFLTGFDGQWLILFYDHSKDVRRGLFKELAKAYENKLTVAEVEAGEAESVMARYGITSFPYILAINNGTPVPYTGKIDLGSLNAFAEKLYIPTFQEIRYSGLKELTKEYKNGEPIFLVLYKNFEVASHYFNALSQQFKFRATIQRSSDPAMFAAAGYHPKDIHEFEGEPDHHQMVYLVVYKNSAFFSSHVKPDDTKEIIHWIFHTHFPHVTSIDNGNFYTVFHGIKPVILLLTRGEQLVDSFNKLSATWHLGASSSNIIFATVDTSEYPLFKQETLKDVSEPGIVFYDPIRASWYYKYTKLVPDTFNKTVMKLIDSYFNKKIPVYPYEKRRSGIYIIIGVAIAVLAFGYRLRSMRNKVD